MRIIHSINSKAEAEYLNTFFKYIGLLVYDEIVNSRNISSSWISHLKKQNDLDGVDIVLNYYSETNIPSYRNRIFLYFDLNENICTLSTNPLPPQIKSLNANGLKRDTRRETLNVLINKIWENDERNLGTINLIKDYYIPKDEDRDLFYILQEVYATINTFESDIIKNCNVESQKQMIITKLFFNSYIKKIFVELWRMQCLLQNNDNPYIEYAKVNTSRLLQTLDRYTETSKPFIEFDGKPLKLNSYNDLYNQTTTLFNKYPWFKSTSFMLLEIIENMDFKKGVIYNDLNVIYKYLLDSSKNCNFPAYYSPIYNSLSKKVMLYELNRNEVSNNFDKVVAKFKESLQIDPQNYNAYYYIGLLNYHEGRHKEAISNFQYSMGEFNIFNINDFHNQYLPTFSELLQAFQTNIMLGNLSKDICHEYSAKDYINRALLSANHFDEAFLIRKIADQEEISYQDFIKYHNFSTPVFDLYTYLKPWFKGIINDRIHKEILQNILSKWDDGEKFYEEDIKKRTKVN